MTKDRRLGKGLAALLGTPIEGEDPYASNVMQAPAPRPRAIAATQSESQPSFHGSNQVGGITSMEIDVTTIDANPFQPRREFNPEEIASLAESIRSHQQLQPISVRQVGNRYQLISGERRLRATMHAGLTKIRAEVRDADDRLVAELAIIENLQRKDLNAIEKAMSFRRYIGEHRCTQEELANRLKIDRSTVTNFMRLLELPQAIIDDVQRELLTAGHAKTILSLTTEEQQLEFAAKIKSEGWSVRETERRVAEKIAEEEGTESGRIGIATRVGNRARSEQVAQLEQELKRVLGTKVEIRPGSRGNGKIVIHYANLHEFERLRDAMTDTPSVSVLSKAA